MNQYDIIYYIRLLLQVIFAVLVAWSAGFNLRLVIRDRSIGSLVLVLLSGSLAVLLTVQVASPVLVLCCMNTFPEWAPFLSGAFVVALVLCILAWGVFLSMRDSVKLSQIIRVFRTAEGDLIRELDETHIARENVERMLRDQFHFLRAAAHDLRAPLRSIAGFLDLIKAEPDQPPNQEYLAFIGRACDKMADLIEDLSTLGRIETEPVPHEWVDMNTLVAETVDLFNGEAHKVIVGDLPHCYGSKLRLGQLFQNLIGNALKFGSNKVEISGLRRDKTVLYSVCDDGIGIAPEYHQKIFEQFQRLNLEEEYPGTGIGLTICQKIVQQHGGKIWVESALGEGSRFYVLIPYGKR